MTPENKEEYHLGARKAAEGIMALSAVLATGLAVEGVKRTTHAIRGGLRIAADVTNEAHNRAKRRYITWRMDPRNKS